jgi:hypothetical protein
MVASARRLTVRERRGAALALGTGGAAIAIPFLLDLGGLHYLISKNVMAAVPVLLIGAAIVLGAERARSAGLAGAVVAAGLFLVLVVDEALDPALQRPDYRAVARALGPPPRDEAVVSEHLGDQPLALYDPGAAGVPAAGWPVRQIVVVHPLARADAPQGRAPTPPAPAGFRYEGRVDRRTYTLICFGSAVPRTITAPPLLALIGGGPPTVQVWPHGPAAATARSVCSR